MSTSALLPEIISLKKTDEVLSDPKVKERQHQIQNVLQKHQPSRPGAGRPEKQPWMVRYAMKQPPPPDIVPPPPAATLPAGRTADSKSVAEVKEKKEQEKNREFHLRFCRWQQQRLKKGRRVESSAVLLEGAKTSGINEVTTLAQLQQRTPRAHGQKWQSPETIGASAEGDGLEKGGSGVEKDDDGSSPEESNLASDSGPQPRYVEHIFARDVWTLAKSSTERVRRCAGGGSSTATDFFKKPDTAYIDQTVPKRAEKAGPGDIQVAKDGSSPHSLGTLRALLLPDSESHCLGGHYFVSVPETKVPPSQGPATARRPSMAKSHPTGPMSARGSISGESHPLAKPTGTATHHGSNSEGWFLTEAQVHSQEKAPVAVTAPPPREEGKVSEDPSPAKKMSSLPQRPLVPLPWTCKVTLHEVREIESIADLRLRIKKLYSQAHRGNNIARLIPEPNHDMELVARAIGSSNADFRQLITYRAQDTSSRYSEALQHARQLHSKDGVEQHIRFEGYVREERRKLYRNGANEIHRWMDDRTRLYGMKFDRMDLSQGTISWERTLAKIRKNISTALETEFCIERHELQVEFIEKFKIAFDKRFPVLSDEAQQLLSLIDEMFRANLPVGYSQISKLVEEIPLDLFLLPDVVSLIFSLAMNLGIEDQHWLKIIKQRTQFLDEKKRSITPPLPDDENVANASWVLKAPPAQQGVPLLRWAFGRAAASTLSKEELQTLLRGAELSRVIAAATSLTQAEVHPDVVEGLTVMIQFQPWSKEIAKMDEAASLLAWLRKCGGGKLRPGGVMPSINA
jgi:hypothetical protein